MCMNLKANGLSKTPAFRSGFEGCGIHGRKAMAPLKLRLRLQPEPHSPGIHGRKAMAPLKLRGAVRRRVGLLVSMAERLWPH